MRTNRPLPNPERGQVVPFMVLAIMVLVGLMALAISHSQGLNDRAQARSAADAAALAGAAGGHDDAVRLAAANGGELVGWSVLGREVEVVVRVGEAQATARAEATVNWVVP